MESSYFETYLAYIQQNCSELRLSTSIRINAIISATSWEEPIFALDFNNFAVLALIEAEQSEELSMREIYLDMAINALSRGLDNHPLCAAHFALVQSMLGKVENATEIAFETFLNTLQLAYQHPEKLPIGLIYFPQTYLSSNHWKQIEAVLEADNGSNQALFLLSEVLYKSQMTFYNQIGLRLLNLAVQVLPQSTSNQFKLGIAKLLNHQPEGLLQLHQALKLSPNSACISQALYLAYKDLGNLELARFWLESAQNFSISQSSSLSWQWCHLTVDSPITYVPFEDQILLAVEPSFYSIVTSVLIAEGDWFEKEIEFWRTEIQPGMTVIDVGANVGVYTFSAALRVGSSGHILAVEPFSGCTRCLEETCRLNQLDWITIHQGAASNYNGTARLFLHRASELNEIVSSIDEIERVADTSEEVKCFSLDSLIQQEKIDSVDFIKIDAEGHELQVLQGSEYLLNKFSPVILYENISGRKGSNSEVADFLKAYGYQVFIYQPYIKKLVPISAESQLQDRLNIIALPADKTKNYIAKLTNES